MAHHSLSYLGQLVQFDSLLKQSLVLGLRGYLGNDGPSVSSKLVNHAGLKGFKQTLLRAEDCEYTMVLSKWL